MLVWFNLRLNINYAILIIKLKKKISIKSILVLFLCLVHLGPVGVRSGKNNN